MTATPGAGRLANRTKLLQHGPDELKRIAAVARWTAVTGKQNDPECPHPPISTMDQMVRLTSQTAVPHP